VNVCVKRHISVTRNQDLHVLWCECIWQQLDGISNCRSFSRMASQSGVRSAFQKLLTMSINGPV
jgi:hypothetical protein